MPKKEIIPKPRKKGKKEITSREKVESAHITMAEAGFNPLEWAIKIAKGEALTEDHPLLPLLLEWADMWRDNIEQKGMMLTPDDLDEFVELCRPVLTDSHTPIKLRSDHVKDLLGYVYPKLKAVEHSGQIQHDLKLTPLSQEEIQAFRDTFDEEY